MDTVKIIVPRLLVNAMRNYRHEQHRATGGHGFDILRYQKVMNDLLTRIVELPETTFDSAKVEFEDLDTGA